MTVEIKGVHNYHVSDKTEEYISKKLKRIEHMEDMIADIHISASREKNGEYKTSVDMHFRWGNMAHINVTDRDLFKAIDLMFDKLQLKATKEKEKVQEHHV